MRHGGLEWIRKKKSYKQLNWTQRERLCVLLQDGSTQQHIAKRLGGAASTISREIRRHGGRNNYCATKAQQRATEQKTSPKKATKVTKRHWHAIKKGLRLGWSPENINCRIKAERFERHISHTTIYRLLEKDRIAGGQLYKLLPRSKNTLERP